MSSTQIWEKEEFPRLLFYSILRSVHHCWWSKQENSLWAGAEPAFLDFLQNQGRQIHRRLIRQESLYWGRQVGCALFPDSSLSSTKPNKRGASLRLNAS